MASELWDTARHCCASVLLPNCSSRGEFEVSVDRLCLRVLGHLSPLSGLWGIDRRTTDGICGLVIGFQLHWWVCATVVVDWNATRWVLGIFYAPFICLRSEGLFSISVSYRSLRAVSSILSSQYPSDCPSFPVADFSRAQRRRGIWWRVLLAGISEGLVHTGYVNGFRIALTWSTEGRPQHSFPQCRSTFPFSR